MLYAMMHAAGELEDKMLFTLRRKDGLPGHPTIDVPGVASNTGSLGMGISKAKGMIYANRSLGRNLRVNVVLGDGELQEGQIWESLSSASRDKLSELTVIVDANQIQSDTWVEETLSLGDVKSRVEAIGWDYFEVDGHSIPELIAALSESSAKNSPKWIQATTKKGKGVKFMEHFPPEGKFYKFHSGAPTSHQYQIAIRELLSAMNIQSLDASTEFSNSITNAVRSFDYLKPKERENSIIDEYSSVLLSMAMKHESVQVMDADLTYDTGTYKVKENLEEKYIQCGIAEQDMVSMAGGMALQGLKPIVHSFGTFLTMRAYEQIFNNATERSSIIYVGFLAGIIPGPPGVSHQAVTDSPIMSVIPNMGIFEPATKHEIELALEEAIRRKGPNYIRIQSVGGPINQHGTPFTKYTQWGESSGDILILCSGLASLTQTLIARDHIKNVGYSVSVASVFDFQIENDTEIIHLLEKSENIFVIENSLPGNLLYERVKYLNETILNTSKLLFRIGVDTFPECGQNHETLQAHGLDGQSIAMTILDSL
jgi:transketolase